MAFLGLFAVGNSREVRKVHCCKMSNTETLEMGLQESTRYSRLRHHVFVYGTLKRGFPNSHLLKDAEMAGHFETEEKYPLVVGGEFYSPYLLNIEGKGHNVRGEVYRVDDDMLEKLDELERVGVNYTRKAVNVRNSRGEKVEVLAYLKCNYTRDLLEAECHPEYNDRRYVPRHMREKVIAERQRNRNITVSEAKAITVRS